MRLDHNDKCCIVAGLSSPHYFASCGTIYCTATGNENLVKDQSVGFAISARSTFGSDLRLYDMIRSTGCIYYFAPIYTYISNLLYSIVKLYTNVCSVQWLIAGATYVVNWLLSVFVFLWKCDEWSAIFKNTHVHICQC
jgi:hypothetical protein